MIKLNKKWIRAALLVAFCVINAIFFISVYQRIVSDFSSYKNVFPTYSCEFLMFWVLVIALLFILLGYVCGRGKGSKLYEWYNAAVDEFTSIIEGALDKRHILWITVSSALMLFLELCIIRWMSAMIPELSQYRNFSLLACFLGIGVGFLTGGKRPYLMPLLLPLLGLQFLQISLIAAFYPAMEDPAHIVWIIAKSPLWQFVFIVFVMIAPGQLVGRLLHKKEALGAYGANLLGSILGVIVLNIMAAFWTPPWIWLLVIALVYLFMFHKSRAFIQGLAVFFVLLLVAFFTYKPFILEVYSPYQRLTLKTHGIGHKLGDGRTGIYSNDLYYQSFSTIYTDKIIPELDVKHNIPNADLGPVKNDLKGKKVLALGTGAGANIPSLLKAGAESVVAVDIDPTIVYLGRLLNANYSYWHPKVTVVVDDARSFLRRSDEKYDYIFFLWIDSHPYVKSSHGFRIDSFVYTKECFQQALSRLNPGGKILIYSWMNEVSSKRILLTLREAVSSTIYTFKVMPYPSQGLFIVSDEPIERTGSRFVVPWPIEIPRKEHMRILSDDWPFLYLEGGVKGILKFFPFLAMVLIVSMLCIYLFVYEKAEVKEKRIQYLEVFFLFGVAFMLVETVSIMRVALLMGNTWKVTGYVIISILTMAYIGNYLVLRNRVTHNLFILAGGLVCSLLLCWGIDANQLASYLGNVGLATWIYLILLSLPIIFSSILFSVLIKGYPDIDQALGSNLLGGMFGGCLEYMAMLSGYRTLILLIPFIYVTALLIYSKKRHVIS